VRGCVDLLFDLRQIGHIAIQRGHRLEWSQKTECFTNDEGANKLPTGECQAPWKS
jgi:hypothetical protein